MLILGLLTRPTQQRSSLQSTGCARESSFLLGSLFAETKNARQKSGTVGSGFLSTKRQ